MAHVKTVCWEREDVGSRVCTFVMMTMMMMLIMKFMTSMMLNLRTTWSRAVSQKQLLPKLHKLRLDIHDGEYVDDHDVDDHDDND